MLPPGTPSYEGLVRTRLDLSLKDLAWALRTGRREAQTMVTDFLRAHPGAVDPINLYILIRYFFPYSEKNIHHDAKNDDDYSENDDDYSDLRTLSEAALEELLENDDDYSDLRTLSEAALDELLKHQPENVPVELEQFLFKLVIDQAERRSDIGEARERARVRERRRRRERERERERSVRASGGKLSLASLGIWSARGLYQEFSITGGLAFIGTRFRVPQICVIK